MKEKTIYRENNQDFNFVQNCPTLSACIIISPFSESTGKKKITDMFLICPTRQSIYLPSSSV